MFTRMITLIVSIIALTGLAFSPTAMAAEGRTEFQISVDQYAFERGLPAVPWINIPSGAAIQLPAVKEPFTSGGAMYFYSPTGKHEDGAAYIGEDAVTNLAARSHWLAPGFIAAHEWGHSLWMRDGLDFRKQTQAFEDGADCIAGSWLRWYTNREHIPFSLNDVFKLSDMVTAISRNEYTVLGDTHGTHWDRSVALVNGFTFGIRSCDHFKKFA